MGKSGGFGALLVASIIAIAGYAFMYTPNENAYNRVALGDTEATVLDIMGRPRSVESKAPFLKYADYEYQYYLWPFPKTLCIGLRGGFVVEKGIRE